MKVFSVLASFVSWAMALEPSALPPGGIAINNAPVFVVLGSDDNHSSVDWLVSELAKRKHLDGSKLRMSFYSNASEDANWVAAHQSALADGHEISMHTYSHKDLTTLTVPEIKDEITENKTDLSSVIGLESAKITGLRAPFLAVDDSVFIAEQALGVSYDCSLEEGWQSDRNATNMYWPYTMDHLSTSSTWAAQRALGIVVKDEALSDHPNLWQVPVYTWDVPTGAAAVTLGLPSAFCDTLSQRAKNLGATAAAPNQRSCKVTGFDYNQWYQFGVTGQEFTQLLRYNLDQRIKGNHAPLTIGMHANYYGPEEPEHSKALLDFIDYALTLPQVRFVSSAELVEWMKNPRVPNRPIPEIARKVDHAGFSADGVSREHFQGVKLTPGTVELKF